LHDSGYPREEPSAGKPHARICEVEAEWLSYSTTTALGLGGVVILSIDYTSSYEDAMRGVVQWNERAEAAFEDAHPDAP
jgi:hypothetical protein